MTGDLSITTVGARRNAQKDCNHQTIFCENKRNFPSIFRLFGWCYFLSFLSLLPPFVPSCPSIIARHVREDSFKSRHLHVAGCVGVIWGFHNNLSKLLCAPSESSPPASPSCFFHGRGLNPNCKGFSAKSRQITSSWLSKHNGSHLGDAVGQPTCSSCDKFKFDFLHLHSLPVLPSLPAMLSPLSPVKKKTKDKPSIPKSLSGNPRHVSPLSSENNNKGFNLV